MSGVITVGEDFQQRCAAWRRARFPEDSGNRWMVLCKAGEELGELFRACLGEHEGRPGRGDPALEAAQTFLVLASLIGEFYPDRNLLAEAFDELHRHERILRESINQRPSDRSPEQAR